MIWVVACAVPVALVAVVGDGEGQNLVGLLKAVWDLFAEVVAQRPEGGHRGVDLVGQVQRPVRGGRLEDVQKAIEGAWPVDLDQLFVVGRQSEAEILLRLAPVGSVPGQVLRRGADAREAFDRHYGSTSAMRW